MGRSLFMMGAVATDAVISGLSWSVEAPAAWILFTGVTSVLGMIAAVRQIAGPAFPAE